MPLPMNPDPSAPVEEVSPGIFLVEDGAPASGGFHATATDAYSLPLPGGDDGTNITYQPEGGPAPMFYTNGLWLEIVDYNPSDTNLQWVLHNTSDNQLYQLNSATNLLSTNWVVGELLWGDLDSDETWFTPVPNTNPMTFYRAHQANAIMQVGSLTDSVELNPTNTSDPGSNGIIGLQNGVATAATNDITVYYTIGGTAQNGIDYSNLPGVLTLAAGMQDTNITIYPAAMGLQPDKTIIITLLQNSNYLIDPLYAFTTNILFANPELLPIARGDNERTCPNTSWSFALIGHDASGLTLTYSIVTWPAHGTLNTSDLPQVTYIPPTNCFGVCSKICG
jgi:hypothetical protein